MVRFVIALNVAAFLFAIQPVDCHSADIYASAERVAQGRRLEDPARKDRLREREKRFITRTLDELKDSLSVVEDEIKVLEKEIEAITLLESPQREKDFTDILDWYHDYGDWLRREMADFEDDLALVSSQVYGEWKGRYDGMVMKQDSLAGELEKKVKRYRAEEERLAGTIERRKQLQEQFGEMQERLSRIEQRLGELSSATPERKESERKAEKLRADVRVVQNELVSLPLVDEDLLKHYAVLVERGGSEIEWIFLKRDQYETMGRLAAAIGRDPRRDAATIEAATRQAVRVFESQIKSLSRKIDDLDRKRSRITPAGSLKEVERSGELRDFYDRLRSRYDNEIRRLRVLIDACDADLAEVLSEK